MRGTNKATRAGPLESGQRLPLSQEAPAQTTGGRRLRIAEKSPGPSELQKGLQKATSNPIIAGFLHGMCAGALGGSDPTLTDLQDRIITFLRRDEFQIF